MKLGRRKSKVGDIRDYMYMVHFGDVNAESHEIFVSMIRILWKYIPGWLEPLVWLLSVGFSLNVANKFTADIAFNRSQFLSLRSIY